MCPPIPGITRTDLMDYYRTTFGKYFTPLLPIGMSIFVYVQLGIKQNSRDRRSFSHQSKMILHKSNFFLKSDKFIFEILYS